MTGPGAGAEHDLVRAQDLTHGGRQPRREHADPDHHQVQDTGAGSGLLVRAVIAAVAGLLAAVAAVLLARNGVNTDDFPPFLTGVSATPITRYSGPWLTAGAGVALLAALLLLRAVIDLVRWVRWRRSGAEADDGTRGPRSDVIGPTSS